MRIPLHLQQKPAWMTWALVAAVVVAGVLTIGVDTVKAFASRVVASVRGVFSSFTGAPPVA